MSVFGSVGPFREGLGLTERGTLAIRLTKACRVEPAAAPASRALGDPSNSGRRAQALAILDALPPPAQRRILAAYEKLSRRLS